MGPHSTAASFSAKQRYQLGWLPATILTVGTAATLAPLEGTTGIRGVAVHASATRDYWLEYRRPVAEDAKLPAGATNGVLVHMVDRTISPNDSTVAVGPESLDLSPGDHTLADATLKAGHGWVRPRANGSPSARSRPAVPRWRWARLAPWSPISP